MLVMSPEASELGPALGRPKRWWLQWQLHPSKPASMDRGEHDQENDARLWSNQQDGACGLLTSSQSLHFKWVLWD